MAMSIFSISMRELSWGYYDVLCTLFGSTDVMELQIWNDLQFQKDYRQMPHLGHIPFVSDADGKGHRLASGGSHWTVLL